MCYDFSMSWILSGIAFFIIGFWVWRTMRADYDEEDILTLILILMGTAGGLVMGWKWWGLGGVLAGVVLALILWCRFKKWNVWEWGDVVARASLVMGAISVAGNKQWLPAAALVIGVMVLWGLAKTYREFRWYKSGKAGLVGMIGGMWWMGVWIGLAPWQMYKVYLAAWVFVGLAVAIYLRSGHKFSEIWPKKR